MNRKYTKKDYLEKIEYLKGRIPDISITTDLIVGFPGEREEDFNETLDLIRQVEYDGIFGFVYSERPGTKAAELEDDIPKRVKIERLQEVINLQRKYSLKNNKRQKGKILEVLAEKKSKKDVDMLCGRTRTNKVVNFKGREDLIGRLIKTRIIDYGPNSLIGELTG